MIRVLIADNQALTRQGIIALITSTPGMEVVGVAINNEELKYMAGLMEPDVILLDSADFYPDSLNAANLLVLYNPDAKESTAKFIAAGVQNFVCKNCSHLEIRKAITLTAKREKFFCGYSIQHLRPPEGSEPSKLSLLSLREAEIVNLIATGLTNKAIAEQLFISIHTVSTHRKNIIKKLGFTFKNASDLVTYLSKL